jgi:DNA-binding transcriptional LysR family regulator
VLELRHLRYFVAVAEDLNFSRAAERLHMAQPPLSAAIRQLELELGTELLVRTTREVHLTDAGATFLVGARRILDELDYVVRRFPSLKSERMRAVLETLEFDRVYGAWWDRVVREDAKPAVLRSADRYLAALSGQLP